MSFFDSLVNIHISKVLACTYKLSESSNKYILFIYFMLIIDPSLINPAINTWRFHIRWKVVWTNSFLQCFKWNVKFCQISFKIWNQMIQRVIDLKKVCHSTANQSKSEEKCLTCTEVTSYKIHILEYFLSEYLLKRKVH